MKYIALIHPDVVIDDETKAKIAKVNEKIGGESYEIRQLSYADIDMVAAMMGYSSSDPKFWSKDNVFFCDAEGALFRKREFDMAFRSGVAWLKERVMTGG